jgi:YbgC/YbaW family acyl-CoA thioester hydrolase
MANHVERFRVRWHDTDASSRIHFTNAFLWAEIAEAALVRNAGIDVAELIDYPRRHVEAEYLLPLRFDDEVELRLRVDSVGTTSVTFSWDVVVKGDTIAIRGRHTAVRVDSDGRPAPIDDATRRRLDA